MIRRPPRSTRVRSSAASDVYKRQDLYGRELTVTFLHFLHGEKNYAGLDALKQGIAQDVVDLLDWREQQAFAKSVP